ncbi:MAG TPA: S9 family peptidase [Thermomicrobiaceae bacterium]|nr:S9 family peptidase [Thermomicrobiaceae bacterium]
MAGEQDNMLGFEQAVSATMVADVRISPDGRQVAYVTTPASKAGEFPESTIWLVSTDGGSPRRLTGAEVANGGPRWSPDSRRIAFVSDRRQRGVPQLYLVELGGGEAVRLTDCAGGVAAAAWSPDGGKLAFSAMDAETDEEKQRREERNDHKVMEADTKRASLWLLDVPADAATLATDTLPEARRISPEGMHAGTFSWAPDGTRLAVTSTPSPKAHYVFSPELVLITTSGEVTNLGRFEGLMSAPEFSPDGKTLAFIAAEQVIPALFSLQTMPVSGGEPHIVAPGLEGSFQQIAWLPDGKRLVAGVEIKQSSLLKIVDLASGELSDAIAPFKEPGVSAFLSLSADGKRLAFAHASDYAHADVYTAELGGEPRKLTDLNPWTREQQWGQVREVRWRAKDGQEIEGMVILPVGYQEGQRYPLLLHIHGGPCGAWTHALQATWHNWGQFLAQRGYAVFLPNPRGSSGRGTKFLSEIVGCYGEPDWDDLMSGVDYLVEQGIADPEQLIVGGWSGGGFLTNWTITHSDRFKAAVSGAGIANWVSFQGTADVRSVFDSYLGRVDEEPEVHWRLSPIRNIKHATTPTLILYGEADARVPVTQGYELYEGLKGRGVETELVAYPREPHAIGERKHQLDLLPRAIGWYQRHLGRE